MDIHGEGTNTGWIDQVLDEDVEVVRDVVKDGAEVQEMVCHSLESAVIQLGFVLQVQIDYLEGVQLVQLVLEVLCSP